MADYLLDSNVLIRHLRRHQPTTDLLSAGDYLRRYRAQGVVLDKPDAVIGATAVRHGLVLVTYNSRRFPMPELRLYQRMPE